MAVIDDLNLKTKLVISNKDYDFELNTILDGSVAIMKLDGSLVIRQDLVITYMNPVTNEICTIVDKEEIPKNTKGTLILYESPELSEGKVVLDPTKKPRKKRGKYRTWLEKDIQYVKDNYGKIPTKDIADHLGIKKLSRLHSKAYHIGLKKYNKILPSKTPSDPEKTNITIRQNPVDHQRNYQRKDDAEEFLEWLNKWENATFTKADVRRCTTLSRKRIDIIIEDQLIKGTIKRLSDYEFAKLVLNGTG